MSLWKRGRQYWTDFTVAGQRYRKRLGTTNLQKAKRRERDLIDDAGRGLLAANEQDPSACRRRSNLTLPPRECVVHRARSSLRRNASASLRSISATCRSWRSRRRRLPTSSAL